MSPGEITQGKSYVDRHGKIYTVNEIYRRKNEKMVRFSRSDGFGLWKLKDFANQVKEEYRIL